MSMYHQAPTEVTTLPPDLIRHGFHGCQRYLSIQTSRCGQYQRPGRELGTPTPPPNACVVCMDLRSSVCPFCDRAG